MPTHQQDLVIINMYAHNETLKIHEKNDKRSIQFENNGWRFQCSICNNEYKSQKNQWKTEDLTNIKTTKLNKQL